MDFGNFKGSEKEDIDHLFRSQIIRVERWASVRPTFIETPPGGGDFKMEGPEEDQLPKMTLRASSYLITPEAGRENLSKRKVWPSFVRRGEAVDRREGLCGHHKAGEKKKFSKGVNKGVRFGGAWVAVFRKVSVSVGGGKKGAFNQLC